MMYQTSTSIELRPYQREDCEFMKKRKCVGCFNQQRTGKTPTSIRSIVERGINRTLIVCPKSAIYQWEQEWELWGGQKATAIAGTPKQKEDALKSYKTGALIISYGSLKSTKTYTGLLNEILKKDIQAVILDEAHRIKDSSSANAQACFQLTKIPVRIALTGTPAPNKPEEIWSILHFLYPNQFKYYWPFIREFFNAYQTSNKYGKTYMDIIGVKNSKKEELTALLNTIATQRKRKEIMQWLPEKDYQRIMLKPTPKQKKCLEELATYFETENIITQNVLDRLIRYRQICLDPGILGIKSKSPKTEWILDYLKDYPDRPTIIFSKFTTYLKILEKTLDKFSPRLIIGDTTAKARQQAVDDFQSGKCNILLINIDAGKEALTLDRATATIFTDKFPPVGDIEQAEDRFVATTESKKDKDHVIYELVLKDTYDEEVYKMLAKRASAVDCINNFKQYMKGDK